MEWITHPLFEKRNLLHSDRRTKTLSIQQVRQLKQYVVYALNIGFGSLVNVPPSLCRWDFIKRKFVIIRSGAVVWQIVWINTECWTTVG